MMICLLIIPICPLNSSYAGTSGIITDHISVGNQNESGVGWSWVTHDGYNPDEPISDTNYSGIFTMDGLHIEYSGKESSYLSDTYALSLPGGAKVIVLNNNTINAREPNINWQDARLVGICIYGQCEITGMGTLNLSTDMGSISCKSSLKPGDYEDGSLDDDSYFNAGNLTIKNTNINITNAGNISADKLSIENSNININNTQGFILGAFHSPILELYNSNVYIMANDLGIIARGKTFIDGGSITVKVDDNIKQPYAIMASTVDSSSTPSYGDNMVIRAKDSNGLYTENVYWDNRNTEKDGFSYYRSVKTGKMVRDIRIWENPVKLTNTTIQGTVNQTVFNNVKMGIELTSDSFKGTGYMEIIKRVLIGYTLIIGLLIYLLVLIFMLLI